jgi:hypothetical protein
MDEIDIMISLQGIINRSKKGDMMMIGRNELPIEQVVDFIVDNFNGYKCHPLSYSIATRKNNNDLLNEIKFIQSNADKIEYVRNNIELLNSLRLSIDEITTSIINIIENENTNKIIKNPKPTFIGLFLSDEDRLDLTHFVNSKVIGNNFTIYNHHLTLSYKPTDLKNQIQPLQYLEVEISKLVIRKSDGASAYFVKNIIFNEKNIYIDNPHITSKIPNTENPVISQSFVHLTDDSVEIIEYNKIIKTICIWSK